MDEAERRAEELVDRIYSAWHPKASELDPGTVQVIAQALREERARALEEAAKVAEEYPPYTIWDPRQGLRDCGCSKGIAENIRALGRKEKR